ncbi:MAG: glycosyltransferase family 2 protein [Candidatus Paceibacterota bacterium]|jgi:glycosyltransferase involved in cell wall biosynthesis
MANRKISIIVPCYNEVQTVEKIMQRLVALSLPGWEKEIIVVDDASHDGTKEKIKQYEEKVQVVYCEKNGGKGTAVRRGIVQATGDFVLIQDADLEYDPADIPNLLAVLESGVTEVVYGSRTLDPKTRRGGLLARRGVWFITKLVNTLYRLSLTDVWTCYKLFPRAAASDFVAGHFESELLFTAALARRGYRFAEVPISYYPREAAEGKKIRYRDGIYAIMVIGIDWLKHL